jgi:hypothetical protein
VPRATNTRRRLVIALGLTVAFMVALGGFLFWYLGGQEKAAKREANKFITALVKDDPSAAPQKGDEYVRGIWRFYRRVDSAKLIDTHQRSTHHSNGNSGYSWWVADMLLHTGRGLAVVELAFEPNHLDPNTQIIDLMYELTPNRIPDGTLDRATLARVRSDQRERKKVADDFTFTFDNPSPTPSVPRPAVPVPTPRPAPGKPVQPPKIHLPPVIKCIRRAHGDVTKIQRCARLAQPSA